MACAIDQGNAKLLFKGRDLATGDSLGGNIFWTSTAELTFPLGLPRELGLLGRVFTDWGSLFDLDSGELEKMPERVTTLAKLYTSVLHVVAGPSFPTDPMTTRQPSIAEAFPSSAPAALSLATKICARCYTCSNPVISIRASPASSTTLSMP